MLLFCFYSYCVSQHTFTPQAERAALVKELAALRQKKEQLKAEIEKYRECDPDIVEEMRKLYCCLKRTFT